MTNRGGRGTAPFLSDLRAVHRTRLTWPASALPFLWQSSPHLSPLPSHRVS